MPIDAEEMRPVVEALRLNGYAKIKTNGRLSKAFENVCLTYPRVEQEQKREFSFVEETDGFIPFGLEYSVDPDRPDLCERFCYWPRNETKHRRFSFSNSPFYLAVSAYERHVREVGGALLAAILRDQGSSQPFVADDSSYLQFCAYRADILEAGARDREYLQDPHEDGHLLTFVRPTGPGLTIFSHGKPVQPLVDPDELVVFPGSLLEALTDGHIRATWHAVTGGHELSGRMSMMYFMNPPVDIGLRSIHEAKPLDFAKLANDRHVSFGNMDLVS